MTTKKYHQLSNRKEFYITTNVICEFESRSWQHVLDTTLCDKVCQ